jgi:integrase
MREYLTSDLLFPSLQNLQKGHSGELSVNGTTDLRTIVKEETGVDFDLRACRRTFGQNCLDQGVPLDATSRMMGHATSKTTETYYARKKNDQAVSEAQQAWTVVKASSPVSQTQPVSNPPLIGKNEYLPGYG